MTVYLSEPTSLLYRDQAHRVTRAEHNPHPAKHGHASFFGTVWPSVRGILTAVLLFPLRTAKQTIEHEDWV